MWTGITCEQQDTLLKLSDVARRAGSTIQATTCEELGARGLITKAADGQWYLSRAGWQFLLPS
jgi:hypothetical protein